MLLEQQLLQNGMWIKGAWLSFVPGLQALPIHSRKVQIPAMFDKQSVHPTHQRTTLTHLPTTHPLPQQRLGVPKAAPAPEAAQRQSTAQNPAGAAMKRAWEWSIYCIT